MKPHTDTFLDYKWDLFYVCMVQNSTHVFCRIMIFQPASDIADEGINCCMGFIKCVFGKTFQ